MSQPPSQRATVKRIPDRGVYDRATIDKVLDDGLICHVGFSTKGQAFGGAIPLEVWRLGCEAHAVDVNPRG